jgi:hypothetical protein
LVAVGGLLVEFLTDREAAAYGRYVAAPSRSELERVFFLDDADKALISRRRGDHNRPVHHQVIAAIDGDRLITQPGRGGERGRCRRFWPGWP